MSFLSKIFLNIFVNPKCPATGRKNNERPEEWKKIATKFETKAQVEKIQIKIAVVSFCSSTSLTIWHETKVFSIPCVSSMRWPLCASLSLAELSATRSGLPTLYKIVQCALNSKIHHARKNRSVRHRRQPRQIVSRPIKWNVKWLVLCHTWRCSFRSSLHGVWTDIEA